MPLSRIQKNVERLKLIRDKNNDIRNTVSIFDVAVSDILGSEEFSMSEDIREWEKLWGVSLIRLILSGKEVLSNKRVY